MAASLWKHTRLLLSRLTVPATTVKCQPISTNSGPLLFRATSCVNSSTVQLKRKRRPDSQRNLEREKKTYKKLKTMLDKIMKSPRQLKPIDELRLNKKLEKDESRVREVPELSYEDKEERALLTKAWMTYDLKLDREESIAMRRALKSQEKALQELRKESEELYQMAIQLDESLIPYSCDGPSYTPPIQNHQPLDGEYWDITNYYDKTVNNSEPIDLAISGKSKYSKKAKKFAS